MDPSGGVDACCVVKTLKPGVRAGVPVLQERDALLMALDTVRKGLAVMVAEGSTVH